jgi:hypothetical protein
MILAILSVLLLLVVAFTRSSRLEQVASSNYQRTTQSRIAAATGLPAAAPLVPQNRNLVWQGQSWSRLSDRGAGAVDPQMTGSLQSQDMMERSITGQTAMGAQQTRSREGQSGGGMVVRDLSGSVNVNFVRSDFAFWRFLQAAAGEIEDQGQSGNRLRPASGSLIQFREFLATRPVAQTTAPIESLTQLQALGFEGWDQARLEALSQQMTVFSLSPELFNRIDGTTLPRRLFRPEDVTGNFDFLQQAYPDRPVELLAQVAVNLADFYDQDGRPTVLENPDQSGFSRMIIGESGGLRITEVYPDSVTPQALGDKGQFVELWNSTTGTLDLGGWSLGVLRGTDQTTPTVRIPLGGTLPSGGFVVVTDNYDQPDDLALPGTGSFVSVFGVRAEPPQKLAIQNQNLDLADTGGTVVLFDDQGAVRDVFSYGDGVSANGRLSFQRPHPRRLLSRLGEATPFRPDQSDVRTPEVWLTDRSITPGVLGHPVDLLRIPTQWIHWQGHGSGESRGAEGVVFHRPATRDDLGFSVVDLFYVPSPLRTHLVFDPATSTTAAFAAGRLNINTANRAAFFSLDDEVDGVRLLSDKMIDEIVRWRVEQTKSGHLPFRNPTDLIPLLDLKSADQLPSLAVLLDQVSVGSVSFEITAHYLSSPSGAGRRPSASRQRWVVAYDQEPRRIVEYDPQY